MGAHTKLIITLLFITNLTNGQDTILNPFQYNGVTKQINVNYVLNQFDIGLIDTTKKYY